MPISAPNSQPQNQPKRAPGTPPPLPPYVVSRRKIADTLSSIPVNIINNGEVGKSLADNLMIHKTQSGDTAFASTDVGVDKAGVNEDCVGISTDNNLVVVADGMGGHSKGEVAAKAVVTAFLENPDKPDFAAKVASMMMQSEDIGDGGACFASAKLKQIGDKKNVEIAKAGDVKVLIIRNGAIFHESVDDSLVQIQLQNKQITPDQALYHRSRNIVTNAINGARYDISAYSQEVKNGDIVLIYTDGIADNLSPADILEIANKNNGNIQNIVTEVSDETEMRMRYSGVIQRLTAKKGGRENLGQFADKYKSAPKNDNRGIGGFQIS